jgi:hypothetical protein
VRVSGFDTRRAIARAFEFEDIDALNKAFSIPTAEEMQAAKDEFDREHVTLKALPLETGKQLAKLAEAHSMDLSTTGFDLSREADEEFAALIDLHARVPGLQRRIYGTAEIRRVRRTAMPHRCAEHVVSIAALRGAKGAAETEQRCRRETI